MTETKIEYAGFWMRFVALIIDYIVIQLLQSFLIIPILGIVGMGFLIPTESFDSFDFDMMSDGDIVVMIIGIISAVAATMLLALSVSILYFSLMESSKHQATLGKMALGLQVTDMEGKRLDFIKALLRQLGKIVSSMTMYIGYIMAGFTSKKQALHDLMANTLVVKK